MRADRIALALCCASWLASCGPSESAPAPPTSPPPVPTATVTEPAASADDCVARQIAAMPAWSPAYEPVPLRPEQQPSTVPQLADGSRLLDLVPGGPTPREHGLLVCRISLAHDRQWDSAGLFGANTAPDVSVYVRVGGGSEARARLPEDSYVGVASVPDVTLAEGTSIEVRLVDRDVAFDDPIATLRAAFPASMPLVVNEGPATLRCVVVALEVTAPMANAALAPALRTLASMEGRTLSVDLRGAPYVRADSDTEEVLPAIHEAASLVGYTNPGVAAAIASVARVDGAYADAYRDAVAHELARVDPVGTPIALQAGIGLTLRSARCEEGTPVGAPVRCTLEADLSNVGTSDPPDFANVLEVDWLSAEQQTIRCLPTPGTSPTNLARPGRAHLVFACMSRALPADGPMLVRVAQGRLVRLARAR